MLIGYDLAIDYATVHGVRRHVTYTRTRVLTDLGTTVIEVPDEVVRKIGK